MKGKLSCLINLFIFCIILLISCTTKPEIGLVTGNAGNGRLDKDQKFFTEKVIEAGGEVILAEQPAGIKRIMENGVDALVIMSENPIVTTEAVKLARQYNIPVIAYDQMIRNCPFDLYVSFDYAGIGEMQAKNLVSACNKGKYGIIGGPVNDNKSYLMRAGQFRILQSYIESGAITVVFEQYVDFSSADEGYRLMKYCLETCGNIDALLVADDLIADGVVKAVLESGSVFPKIAGSGASEEACKRILKGHQLMTVYRPVEALAAKTADVAVKIALERKPPEKSVTMDNGYPVPAILIPAMEVNSRTIKLSVNAREYFRNLGMTTKK
jgi:D-xylose transport system substrate-binding protein